MYTTKLNNTTQKAKSWIKQYNNSNCYSVLNFYSRCSLQKIQAENKCKNRMIENNCHDYRILNGNSSFFTCGYMSQDNKTLFIETVSNIFEIEV